MNCQQLLLLLVASALSAARLSAATFTVTTTADAGPGSLREAIVAANASPGHDFIHFDIAPSDVVHVIHLGAGLPLITEAVTIDGLTQPGALPNSLAQGFNATNLVTLHGGNIPVDPGGGGGLGGPGGGGPGGGPGLPGTNGPIHGLEVRADLVTIRGLRFVEFLLGGNMTNNRSAIYMADVRSNVVESCVFGVDASTSLGDPNWGGITVTNGMHVRIGGASAAQRNLISDNTAWQVRFLNSISNVVEGNFIGLPGLTPAAFLNPGPGVVFEGGHNNRVGGGAVGARNYLGMVGGPPPAPGGGLHDMEGAILLRRSHTNEVLGNWIGLLPPEVLCRLPGGPAPCGLGVAGVSSGVVLEDAHDNRIGSPGAGEGNVIVGGDSGVRVAGTDSFNNLIQGNRIGTHPDGTAASTHGLTTGVLQSSGNNDGVLLQAGAHDNLVGGPAPGERNLISNNRLHGVALLGADTTGNRVLGNFIGADITGTNALPNGVFAGFGDGVHLAEGAHDNDIGGPRPGQGNVISGNHNHGVHLTGTGTRANRVRGNIIGPDLTGTRRLPYLAPLFNDRGNVLSGVRLSDGASDNQIGGGGAGEGNLISANGHYGVEIVQHPESDRTRNNRVLSNRIGTEREGVAPLGNGLGGVRVEADENFIGGIESGEGNLISGNDGPGVGLLGQQNLAQGNSIGLNAAGDARLPNQQAGVDIRGGGNRVGGSDKPARNLISGNAGPGVRLAGPDTAFNELLGNWIGLDAAGRPLGNSGDGVHVTGDAHDNTIGAVEAGNVISANTGHGVALIAVPTIGQPTRDNPVLGNRIGTDADGAQAVPNGTNGVFISGAPHCHVRFNQISGNTADGVAIAFSGDTQVHGNLIGTDATGLNPLPNRAHGVRLLAAAYVTVGDSANPALANRIAFNGGHGVQVLDASAGNRIQGNSITANGGLGIDLATPAVPVSDVTPNDPLDADGGPNELQNFPVLTSAVVSNDTRVVGRLHSTPNRRFTVELFRNAAADPSGHGEGDDFVARQNVTTDGAGNAAFAFDVPGDWTGRWFTATATDETSGDTSEFGPALPVVPPPRFVVARRVGAEFEAGFPGMNGVGYTVLTNADLGTVNWGVYTNLTGHGGTNTFRVPVGTAPYLFFRLRHP